MPQSSSKKNIDIGRGIEVEFNVLREEVLKRIELREHITQITLGLAGAFLGVGLANPAVVFIYPTLSIFLAAGWAQNDIRIRQIGSYIHNFLEPSLPGLGWESYRRELEKLTRFGPWQFVLLSHGGIFAVTQIMAIGVGLYKFTFTLAEQILLGIDIFVLILTLILFEYVRKLSYRIDFHSGNINSIRRKS
jgi:hypothetical protein